MVGNMIDGLGDTLLGAKRPKVHLGLAGSSCWFSQALNLG